jgi:tetratricopeptide (TPR) repeat protein
MKRILCSFFAYLLISSITFSAQAQTLKEAISLSHSARYDEAEMIFTKLLTTNKNDVNILIAAGFNSAWSKNYSLAKKRFTAANVLQPSNTDATKGLGYTYLYQGAFKKAIDIFYSLSANNPHSEEYHMSLGIAYLNAMKKNNALKEFKRALIVNNSNVEATEYITEIEKEKSVVEVSGLMGVTGLGETSKIGLRQAQLGYHFNSENIVYIRYDNALGLDNSFLLKSNFNTNAVGAGFYRRWNALFSSKVEYNFRNLPNNVKQQIYHTEQVVFLPKNIQVKLGGFLIDMQQPTLEWTLMGGLSIPIGKKIKVEPNYYFTNRVAKENRYVLNLIYKVADDFDVAVGFLKGKEIASVKTGVAQEVLGVYAYSNFKITGPLAGTVLFRNEMETSGNNVFVAAMGLKLQIATKK